MLMCVGKDGGVQKLTRIYKRFDGTLKAEEYSGFVFVPLEVSIHTPHHTP